MRIDEIERLAHDVIGLMEIDAALRGVSFYETDRTLLARAVLAMLPIVRAAKAWRDDERNHKTTYDELRLIEEINHLFAAAHDDALCGALEAIDAYHAGRAKP